MVRSAESPFQRFRGDLREKNHTFIAGLPEIAFTSGDELYNYTLSYLPGQRLSACTCPDDETHPGPRSSDGGFVGRSAPEIDMIEAQVCRFPMILLCRTLLKRLDCARGRSTNGPGKDTSHNPLSGRLSTRTTSGSTTRGHTRFTTTTWFISIHTREDTISKRLQLMR